MHGHIVNILNDPMLLDAEKLARDKKLGLWRDNNPTPPWEFRKMQRHK